VVLCCLFLALAVTVKLRHLFAKYQAFFQIKYRFCFFGMIPNWSDLIAIVFGEDYTPVYESNHPVYIVGIGWNGNLAGFDAVVIWT
jgi:hypothetical protein